MKLSKLLPLLQNMYGAQSRAIDAGDGEAWASTYTSEGAYHSPSYERTYRGREDLSTFATSFPRLSPDTKHVVTNVHVSERGEHVMEVALTMMIVQGKPGEESRILRTVTALDEVVIINGSPLVRARRIQL